MLPTGFDNLPLVYFRITKPLKKDFSIPMIDLSKIYEEDEGKRIEIEVKSAAVYNKNKE